MEQERKVKGEVLLDFVKMIRSAKDLPWEKYLTPEDMDLVKSIIIPASWYPAEMYNRMGLAAWEIVAKKNLEMLRAFGSQTMTQLLNGIYRPHLDLNDPHKAVKKFIELQTRYMNFGRIECEKAGDRGIHVSILEFGGFLIVDIWLDMTSAQLKTLIEFNGAKDVKYEIRVTGDKEDPVYLADFKWQ